MNINALEDGRRISYAIDPDNRRTGKSIDGQLQWQLIWQSQLRPIARLKADNTLEAIFYYGDKPNVPEAMGKGGKTYRIVSDQLGSVRLVIDSQTGDVAQELDYDVWGNITKDTNPDFQPFGFAGGLYDHDTKLTRFGARDYDAETGRWTAKDPILFKGGDSNLYGYVAQNPINLVDPRGKIAIVIPFIPVAVTGADIAIGAGLGGVGYGLNWIFSRPKPGNESRPIDASTGTKPIDQSGLGRGEIHDIKDGVGAGARDWTGIAPNGDVITSDPEGNAINHGPADDYTQESTGLYP
ncbi:MAG: RHS repeat-associated core domain-containing protein [Ottowia sp.]|uniref:RHS repeat-associated core domain-containing protein n=1 Tax=Ottowia sp. TaxID=1898956 RepID=UPI0039E66B15